jgi:hypothetical protein
MPPLGKPLFVLALALSTASAAAGQIGVLDLGKVGPDSTRNLKVKTGDLDLTLVNRLPGKEYAIEVEVDFLAIGGLTLEAFRKPDAAADAGQPRALAAKAVSCPEIQQALDASSETALAALRPASEDCRDELERLTTESLGTYELAAGQVLTATIERDGKTWTWTFTTGDRGEWRTTYGFTFVPNEDRKYLTRPGLDADEGKFRIFEQKDREELDFVPSVLFNWMPAKQRGENWIDGFTAGLGWDLEKPVVFAGWSWMYNENLNLTLGVAIHQQTRLLGKYSEKTGDPGNLVGEALEPNQLVETTYGPNVYVGVGFRFDRNNDPFARSAALQKQTAAAEANRLKKAAEAAEAKKMAEDLQKACEAKSTKEHTASIASCEKDHATEATKLAACKKLADDTLAAAKAACPPDVAKKLAEDEAKARKLADCRNKADSDFDVAKNDCEATKNATLATAQATLDQAKLGCAKETDAAKKKTCEDVAQKAFDAAKADASKVSTECNDKAEAARDGALVGCNG